MRRSWDIIQGDAGPDGKALAGEIGAARQAAN